MIHLLFVSTAAALASHKASAATEATSDATADKDATTDLSSGLWVCDPTIRHLLETAPASVSRGEILGRCHQTYSAAACSAAQNALFRGPSVIANLELLCGPSAPAAQMLNAGAVGAGPYVTGYTSGVGFGPLGTGVKVPGANGEPHTSFRGPISPPLTNVVDLDKTTKGKVMPKKFSWEKPSRSNSSGIDSAAEAVRVFDASGLAGASTMQSAGRLPLSSASRATDAIENPMNATEISMNITPVLPVDEQVVSEVDAVQEAGNDVALDPYALAPSSGDWEDNDYWEDTGPLDDAAPATSELTGERRKKSLHLEGIKEHHHKRHKKKAHDQLSDEEGERPDSVLGLDSLSDKLLLRARSKVAPESTDAQAAIAESESGKLLGMAASAQRGADAMN